MECKTATKRSAVCRGRIVADAKVRENLTNVEEFLEAHDQ